MKVSTIGWTDYSGGALNFVMRGLTPGDCEVSAGCAHCYVPRSRFAYRWLPEHTTYYPEKLAKLARMRFPEHSPKRGAPHKPMAFPCDTGDLFHEAVPEPFIMQAFDVMASRKAVIWQILTKRAKRMRDMARLWTANIGALPSHIWLGVTAETQAMANERIPILLDTPAAVRFVSIEPMLEPVPLDNGWNSWLTCDGKHMVDGNCCESWEVGGEHFHGIDWVIVGAESGKDRRPFDVAWARDVYEQCHDAGVPCFLKQDSAYSPGAPLLIDGREVKEWPA